MTLVVSSFSAMHSAAGTPSYDARTRALDATSTDPWGPSHALMEQLRAYTQTRHCADVLHVLHDALTSTGPHWRRVLKALTTIAHCIHHGSPEITLFASAHAALIRRLAQFEHVDAYRLDRGAAVRAEAELVVGMLQQPQQQQSQHQQAPPQRRYTNGAPAAAATGAASSTSSTSSPSSASSSSAPSTTATHTHPHTPRRHPTQHSPASPAPSAPPTPSSRPPQGPLFPTSAAAVFGEAPWHVPTAPPPLCAPVLLSRDDAQDSVHESTALEALLSCLEPGSTSAGAFENDDVWLNIYKLLFLLNTTLPTASDATIRYWTGEARRGLVRRVGAVAGRACEGRGRRGRQGGGGGVAGERERERGREGGDSLAWEVRRLAGELGGVLQGEGVGEVRRRARKF